MNKPRVPLVALELLRRLLGIAADHDFDVAVLLDRAQHLATGLAWLRNCSRASARLPGDAEREHTGGVRTFVEYCLDDARLGVAHRALVLSAPFIGIEAVQLLFRLVAHLALLIRLPGLVSLGPAVPVGHVG